MPDRASAQTPDEIIKRGKVVIAVDTTVPPYGMIDANNQPAGIDIEVANLIGKNLKVPVEFVTVNSPGRIPALLSNRVDMVVAIFSITAERALQVAFSIPYAGQSAVLIAPKATSIKGPDDLKGLKVGVTRGALEDGALTQMNPAGMNLLRFDDGPSVTQALLSGQIDAMGGGDYGEIYLRKGGEGRGVRAEVPAARGAFRHRHPPRKSRAAAMAQHLRLSDQEHRRARRDLAQVSQQHADDQPSRLLMRPAMGSG